MSHRYSTGKIKRTSDDPPEPPRKNLGLAGASDTEIERALGLARDVHDAKTMRELRARLDDIMGRQEAQSLTRVNAVGLLRAISEGLKPSTDNTVGRVDDRTIVTDHPALALLEDLIDALTDLDNGKTHDVFKVPRYARNASLTTKERKWDDSVLEAVLIAKHAHGFKTRMKAEDFVARNLTKAGKKRRGKKYTAKMLKRLRDDRKKRT